MTNIDASASTVRYGIFDDDGAFMGGGREFYPEFQSEDEWVAAGSPVDTTPADVHAMSGDSDKGWVWDIYGRNEMGAMTKHLGEAPYVRGETGDPERDASITYGELASAVEKQLGRTAVRIVIS